MAADYLKPSAVDTLSFATDVSTSSFGTLADSSLEADLLDRLDSDDLWELRREFGVELGTSALPATVANQTSFSGLPLTREEFVEAVARVIGSHAYSESAGELFNQLSAQNDKEFRHVIWWHQLLTCIMERMALQQGEESEEIPPIQEEGIQIHNMAAFCKREIIVKVVQMETASTFCYTLVSKFGTAGVYDAELRCLLTYQIPLGVGGSEEGGKRAVTCWVTDAVYLPDALYLCVSASDRSLHFYDASGVDHAPTFLLSGFPDSPEVLRYCVGGGEAPSKLFIGDDHGDVTTLSFHHPTWSLFARQSSVSSNLYFWKELSEQTEFVTIKVDEKVHESEVNHLMYFPSNTSLLSCSRDPTGSLVSRRLDQCRGPYIFNIPRGVRCFHLARDLQVLVTGSADGIVRLWNPVVTQTPMTSLFGHKYAVEDVRILRTRHIVLSLSLDAVLKAWDLEDHFCLQTVHLGFDFPTRLGEFGKQCIYPGPLHIRPPDTRQPKSPSSTSSSVQNEKILSEYNILRDKYENNEEWNRRHILVVCKNQIAVVQLNRRDLTQVSPHSAREPAPPPPYDKPVHVPALWNKYDTILNVPLIQEPGGSQLEAADSCEEESGLVGGAMPQLVFPLQYLRIHTRRATQNINLEEMSKLVDQCAPHLAINLVDLTKLGGPLTQPTSDRHPQSLTPSTLRSPGSKKRAGMDSKERRSTEPKEKSKIELKDTKISTQSKENESKMEPNDKTSSEAKQTKSKMVFKDHNKSKTKSQK